jgi:DNA polymerase IV
VAQDQRTQSVSGDNSFINLHNLSLFASFEAESKRNCLTSTMDALNQKYGIATLFSASMLPARAAAPARIAFTNITDPF